MSAYPLEADINRRGCDVSFGRQAVILTKHARYLRCRMANPDGPGSGRLPRPQPKLDFPADLAVERIGAAAP